MRSPAWRRPSGAKTRSPDRMMSEIALTVVAAAAVAVVLLGEHRQRRLPQVVAKPLASACFVAVGVLRLGDGDRFGVWILSGLVFCLVGDLLLLSPRAFAAGLASFLVGHVAYVLACASRLVVERWTLVPLLPLAVAAIVVMAWLWPHLGRMRLPVTAYVAVISVMVWGAIAAASAGAVPSRLAVGAGLFYLSDLAVARNRFVSRSLANRAWGLPLYYAGQLLIAGCV